MSSASTTAPCLFYRLCLCHATSAEQPLPFHSLSLPDTYRCSWLYLWKISQRWWNRPPFCSHHLQAREGLPLDRIFHHLRCKEVVRFKWFKLEFMPQVSSCGQTQSVTLLLSHLPGNGAKRHTEMSLLKYIWQPFVAQLLHFPLLPKTHGSPPCSTFIFPHAGWGVYSSSPPCHCLFCWVWTSNSRLFADDIWLHMRHPWLIHTRLMHRICFSRHFSARCIPRSMDECTFFPVVCYAKLKLMRVTVFCALLSCTGLSNY